MINHKKVSRKDVGEDRIAICPKFGCESMKRVKPLKLGFFGFGKYPKCTKHHIPLVYVDERIGELVSGALACLFDKAGLPPSDLLSMVASNYPNELQPFIHGWVYCITTGRGAPVVSRYLDSISHAYMKKLTRKQVKALKKDKNGKNADKYQAVKKGLKEITTQYTRLLKHLRVHSEVLVDHKNLKSLSRNLRNDLNKWQEGIMRTYLGNKSQVKASGMTLMEIKHYYDQILNVGTCRCLLGMDSELKKVKLSAFDRFSAYIEFYSESITEKFTKTDIKEQEKKREEIRVLYKDEQQFNKIERYNNNKNDNLESKLIKSLINLIYQCELEIVEFEKSSKNKLNLNITGGVSLRRFKNCIIASDISSILGISIDTAKRWTHELELSRNRPIKIDIRRTTFKKICEHIEIFSNHYKIYNSFSKVLSDYYENKYKKDFRDELVSIFNKYIKGGGGKSWLSKILGKSRAYIDDLEIRRGDRGKEGPEHYAKYFNLLTNIHLLEKENLDFKEGFKIRDLKAKCHNFIFREMKKRNMINELCESRYFKRIVNLDNKELFDIVVNSLLALTKIERGKGDQNDFIFKYIDLSRKISLTKSRDFFSGKFRNGFPLAKAEGRRLINELRKGFFNAPEVCHNVIYRIKIHINKPRWRAYEMHFRDLRDIQRKELLDLSLGLDIFDKVFLKDAHPFVTKDGQIIDGTNVLYLTRHHLDEDQKYYLIFDYDDNDFKFKIILLASSSHWKVHGNKEDYNRKKELLNARMKHLYKLLQYPYIPNKTYSKIFKSEFNNKTEIIDGQDIRIWSDFSEKIIDNWIERWQARKTLSDKEFYETYYPNFYRERYKPLLRDMKLFKNKDTNCEQPEFWYWYFTHYLKKNIYPSINPQ